MRQIKVITRLYEWEHGRRPGGVGAWTCYFSEIPKFHKGKYAWLAAGILSYAEAEKKAVAEARRRGKWSVFVAPQSDASQMDSLQTDQLEYVMRAGPSVVRPLASMRRAADCNV